MQQTQTIGWVGTGVMGLAMCRRLMAAGHNLVIHSRTRAKAQPLEEAGARWADSPAEVARQTKHLFTMVGFPEDVAQIYQGDQGILSAAAEGAILVDMTTTRPSLAITLAERATARKAQFVDAPVSGGDVGAREGTLAIMVGGEDKAVAATMPLFSLLGKNIVHQGGPGAGQHTKMCNQIVIAGTMIGVCESLLYGARAGLDLATMLSSIRSGAAGCWTLDNLAPRILARNFAPGFYIDHFIKDMGIALEEAARMDIALPGLALVHQLYRAVKAQGMGRKGTQALIRGLEHLSGLDPVAEAEALL